MRKTTLLFALLALSLYVSAQTYVGTMTVGNYTQKDVEVKLSKTVQRGVSMTFFHVKFARMMPVRLNVVIPTLSLEDSHMRGDNIIPTANGKRHEKYLVRNLTGDADAQRLKFTCTMGKKQLTFNGTRKK